MPEELKEKILKHLKLTPDEKFNIKQLQRVIGDISYPTLLKWIMVLHAENKIIIEDYGNVKIVYLNKENLENAR